MYIKRTLFQVQGSCLWAFRGRNIHRQSMSKQVLSFGETIFFVRLLYSTIGFLLSHGESDTGLKRVLKKLWLYLSIFCGLVITIDLFLYIVLKNKDTVNIWEILTQLFIGMYFISAMFKTLTIVHQKGAVLKLLGWFEDHWPDDSVREKNERIIEGYMRTNIFWMSRYVYISFASYITVNLSPIISMGIRYFNTGSLKLLVPFNTWIQYSHPESEDYAQVYLYLLYGSHVASASSICFDTLFCVLLCHLCMHFKLLREELKHSVDDSSGSDISEKVIRECIQKHQKLIEICHEMEEIFSEVIFFNFTASSFNMCVDGFLFVIQPGLGKFRFIMMFATLMSQIFILCWYGQELVNDSTSIGDAAYHCYWYNSSQRFRKMTLYIIQHGQRPKKLIAMKFWEVSLSSFSMLLRASWSYFALLNTVFGDLSYLAPPEGGLLT